MGYNSLLEIRREWATLIGADLEGAENVFEVTYRILERYRNMPPAPTAETQYLLFTNNNTAEGRTIVIHFNNYDSLGDYQPNLEYSYNREDWTTIEPTQTGEFDYSIPFTSTNKIYMRGDNGTQLNKGTSGRKMKFKRQDNTDDITVSGNILALLDNGEGTVTELGEYCFTTLFMNTEYKFENLLMDVDTFGKHSCWQMFYNCVNLTTALEINAVSAGAYAFNSMYNGCTSLTTAPYINIPSNSASQQMWDMFNRCTSLNYIKYTGAKLSTYVSTDWLENASASGTFVSVGNSWIGSISRNENTVPEGWDIVTE